MSRAMDAGLLATLWALVASVFALLAALGIRRLARRYRAGLRELAAEELPQQFVFVDPERLSRWIAVSSAGAGLLAALASRSGLVLLAAMLATLLLPRLGAALLRRRRRRRLRQQLPDAIAAVALALRSGASLGQALSSVGSLQPAPIGQEFALVTREQRVGVPLERALEQMSRRVGDREFDIFVAALRIARELGGGLAAALDRIAEACRRRLTMEEKIRALTAQGRMQGVVVSLVPVLVLLGLAAIDPQSARRFVLTPEGWAALGLVAALQAVGWILIRRIVRIDA